MSIQTESDYFRYKNFKDTKFQLHDLNMKPPLTTLIKILLNEVMNLFFHIPETSLSRFVRED